MKKLSIALFTVTSIVTTSVSAEPNSVVLTTKDGHTVTVPIGKDGYIPKKQTPYEDCVDECMDSGLDDGDECSSQCADKEGA